MRIVSLTVLLIAALSCACLAQSGYQISRCSVNCGGGLVAGGNYKLDSSIGQSAVGFVVTTSILHWIGFWAGEVPAPVVADNVTAAKMLPDGTLVSIAGRIATSAVGDFAGFFYVEDPSRTSGIRVAAPPSGVAGLARGSVVNVIGTLATNADDERQLVGPIVIVLSTAQPLGPLGMPNRSLGGGDLGDPVRQHGVTGGSGLNNVGLLIHTWGRVVAAGTGWVQIDDGSGPVTVDTTTLAAQPEQGSYVSIVGIGSLYLSSTDHLRLVLPRNYTDVVPRHPLDAR